MKKDTKTVIILIFIALVIRLASLLTFGFIDSGGGSDTVTYLLLARNLFTGEGLTEFGIPHIIHPPFYPIMIGIFWQLTGELVLAGHLVSTVAGALLVLPVYLLGKYLYNSRTAHYAGLFTAVFPILVYGSVETFAESLYTFLLISGIAAFWITFRRRRVLGMLGAGILIGLSFLTHPSGLAFLPLLLIFLFFGQVSRLKSSWSRFLLRVAVMVIGFCVACLPFWIFIHRVTGAWQVSGSSHFQDLSMKLEQARGTTESEIIFRHMEMIFHPEPGEHTDNGVGMLELATSRPGEFMEIVRYNLEDGYSEIGKTAGFLGMETRFLAAVLGVVVLLFIVFFLATFFRRREFLPGFFLAMMFSPALVFIIITIEHRYFYPYMPLALIIFSRILSGWERRARSTGSRFLKAGVWVLAVIITAGMLLGSGGVILRKWKKTNIPYEYKIIGEWMKDNMPGVEDENIMMFRMGVSHYAGCRWNVFYWGDYPGLCDYLRERGINYLIIDDYKLHMIHPDLRFLMTAVDLPAGFPLIRECEFGGRKVRLLRYDPDDGIRQDPGHDLSPPR
jgi:4-amino-4-deoxy-L-arabinose transferase-like glycosyltransferase